MHRINLSQLFKEKHEFSESQIPHNNKGLRHRRKREWKLELGANFHPGKGVTFKVWAPQCKTIEVMIEGREPFKLTKDDKGYFTGTITDIGPGTLYKYRVDRKESFPDPVSRFQPQGVHGPSMVVDPAAFEWHDQDWPGVELKGQVIYEMHIGAFTEEGTFDAAAHELEELSHLGITLIEVMPVAAFPGKWNQGYDGASLFAPFHLYGDPEAFKRFVDKAHRLGLGVMLDVVYNHFGPDGNYTGIYSDYYLSTKYTSDWGDVINFDGVASREVREFFISNACYWIHEFHLDGLRLDSTQDLYDDSYPHILTELAQRTREVALPRGIVLIAENEPQDIKIVRPKDKGGYGIDGVWNDDFHHAAIVALKGRNEAYYTDYRGVAQEFISLLKRGYLYQGQAYSWQGKSRGTIVTDEPAWAFIFYLQNHDQIANELRGERIHALTDPARYRTMVSLLLLAPETPLLFMGQEFASSKPFLFFADHNSSEQLARNVSEGRRKFLEQFPSHAAAYQSPEAQKFLPDATAEMSFQRSKLDLSERQKNKDVYQLHHDLLKIRREDPVIGAQNRFRLDGAVLDEFSFIIRFFGKEEGDDRLLLINLGKDLHYSPLAEPLLAPSKKGHWDLMWSSDNPIYGGPGIINPCKERGWKLPAASAILLRAVSEHDRPRMEKRFKKKE